MDVYFILWLITQYMVVYFVAQVILPQPVTELSSWLLCPFDMPCPHPFFPLVFAQNVNQGWL